jgi:hypothetical protein
VCLSLHIPARRDRPAPLSRRAQRLVPGSDPPSGFPNKKFIPTVFGFLSGQMRKSLVVFVLLKTFCCVFLLLTPKLSFSKYETWSTPRECSCVTSKPDAQSSSERATVACRNGNTALFWSVRTTRRGVTMKKDQSIYQDRLGTNVKADNWENSDSKKMPFPFPHWRDLRALINQVAPRSDPCENEQTEEPSSSAIRCFSNHLTPPVHNRFITVSSVLKRN